MALVGAWGPPLTAIGGGLPLPSAADPGGGPRPDGGPRGRGPG